MSEQNQKEYLELASKLASGEALTPSQMLRFAALANAAARNDERVKKLTENRKGAVQDAIEGIEGAVSDGFEMVLDSIRTISKDAFRQALTVISTGEASESIRIGNAYMVFPDDKDSPSVELVLRRKDLKGTSDSVTTHATRNGAGDVETHGTN